jgi:hypothetical protein
MPSTRVTRKIVSGTYIAKFHQKINVRRGAREGLKMREANEDNQPSR